MDLLLYYGRPDSLLKPAAAACLRRAEIRDLVRLRPGRRIPAATPPGRTLMVFELVPDPGEALRLVARVRDDVRDAAILGVFDAVHRDEAVSSITAGADAILPQPFHLDALRAQIDALTRPRGDPAATGLEQTAAATSSADLTELVRRVAHEINNPLTIIRGLVQILLQPHREGDDPPSEGEHQKALRTLERQSRRIAEVVQELEYYAGTRRPIRTVVDLRKEVEEALRDLEIEARFDTADAPVSLLADREQIRFAIRNVLGRLGQIGKSLDVRLQRKGDRATIRARSEVPGDLDVEALMLPLARLDASPDRAFYSLAGARGVAHSHGGDLRVRRKGRRIVVRFDLPAREFEPPEPDDASKTAR